MDRITSTEIGAMTNRECSENVIEMKRIVGIVHIKKHECQFVPQQKPPPG